MRMKKPERRKEKEANLFFNKKAILKYFVISNTHQNITFCHCLSLCRLPPSLYKTYIIYQMMIQTQMDWKLWSLLAVTHNSILTSQSFSFCQLFPLIFFPFFCEEKMNKVDYLFFTQNIGSWSQFYNIYYFYLLQIKKYMYI